mmetsp:Transcript_30971/g.62042  ORF Transcript_30971/g.62042 Transcript_30971/m.62042 type:complete len:216 (-) Transcript_30971:280-927(-)
MRTWTPTATESSSFQTRSTSPTPCVASTAHDSMDIPSKSVERARAAAAAQATPAAVVQRLSAAAVGQGLPPSVRVSMAAVAVTMSAEIVTSVERGTMTMAMHGPGEMSTRMTGTAAQGGTAATSAGTATTSEGTVTIVDIVVTIAATVGTIAGVSGNTTAMTIATATTIATTRGGRTITTDTTEGVRPVAAAEQGSRARGGQRQGSVAARVLACG